MRGMRRRLPLPTLSSFIHQGRAGCVGGSPRVQHSWRRGMSIRCAILSAAAILLAGCAGDPTIDREAAVTLEPMAKPASLPTELAWSGLRSEEHTSELQSLKRLSYAVFC